MQTICMLQCLDHKERSLEPSELKITDNFDCMIAVQDALELLITIYWIDLKRKRKIRSRTSYSHSSILR